MTPTHEYPEQESSCHSQMQAFQIHPHHADQERLQYDAWQESPSPDATCDPSPRIHELEPPHSLSHPHCNVSAHRSLAQYVRRIFPEPQCDLLSCSSVSCRALRSFSYASSLNNQEK